MQVPSGGRAIGPIEEGIGFGSQAIGRDRQDLTPIGYPVIGNREGGAGFGLTVTGSTDKLKVKSDKF